MGKPKRNGNRRLNVGQVERRRYKSGGPKQGYTKRSLAMAALKTVFPKQAKTANQAIKSAGKWAVGKATGGL